MEVWRRSSSRSRCSTRAGSNPRPSRETTSKPAARFGRCRIGCSFGRAPTSSSCCRKKASARGQMAASSSTNRICTTRPRFMAPLALIPDQSLQTGIGCLVLRSPLPAPLGHLVQHLPDLVAVLAGGPGVAAGEALHAHALALGGAEEEEEFLQGGPDACAQRLVWQGAQVLDELPFRGAEFGLVVGRGHGHS